MHFALARSSHKFPNEGSGLENRCRRSTLTWTLAILREESFPTCQEKYRSARSCLRTVGFCMAT